MLDGKQDGLPLGRHHITGLNIEHYMDSRRNPKDRLYFFLVVLANLIQALRDSPISVRGK